MGRRLRTGTIAAGVLALAVGAQLATAVERRSQAGGPLEQGLDALQRMNELIAEANEAKIEDVKRLAERAEDAKMDALQTGFKGQTVRGCRDRGLFLDLEGLDNALTDAAVGGVTRNNLGAALTTSRFLRSTVKRKCPGKPQSGIAEALVGEVDDLNDRFSKSGKVGRERARRAADRVSGLKRRFVSGETVYGCDLLEIFEMFQRLDVALVTAEALDPDRQEDKIREELRKAGVESATLVQRWQELPCGPFAVGSRLSWFHVNGFGAPPTRECNFIETVPPQVGATVTDVITQPPPAPQVTKTATIDGEGKAVISMDIDRTGTYTHQTTVTSADGTQVTVTGSQTVDSDRTGDNGECPPPTP